jgi:hypothetical protein
MTYDFIPLEQSVGRVEGKLDMLIARFDSRIADHEDRITATERKVWYASGIAAVLTFLGGKFFYHG